MVFVILAALAKFGIQTASFVAILGAAAEAGLPHLVFASVAGATSGSGVPHFESKAVVERELAGGDLPYTVVAPTYFYDNALGGEREILDGVLALPLPPDHPLQQLDRGDLGRGKWAGRADVVDRALVQVLGGVDQL